MSNSYSKDESHKIAFVLSEDHIRRLVALISDNIESSSSLLEAAIHYKVEFPGSAELSTESLDDVLALPNSGNKQIKAIRMLAVGAEPSIYVRLSDISGYANVRYSVTGTDKQVFYITDKLGDVVGSIRMWHSRLSHADLFLFVLMILWAFAVPAGLIFGWLLLSGRAPDEPLSAGRYILNTSLSYVLVGVLFGIVAVAAKVRSHLFPTAVFMIGDGKERYDRILFWRRTVMGVGIVLPLVVAALSALVTRLIV